MPSISHKRLHTRAFAARVLAHAGQFAHLSKEEIEAELDDLYDLNTRLKWSYDDEHSRGDEHVLAERAAPLVYVKGFNCKLCPQAFDAEVINFVGYRRGVVCALCLNIERKVGRYWRHPPDGFCMRVCPTYLRVDRWREEFYRTGAPVCGECTSSLEHFESKRRSLAVYQSEALSDVALAWLLQNDRFRHRVKRFAPNLQLLRFDPRRIQTEKAA